MWASILIKIAPISFWVSVVWEWVWVCEWRQGQHGVRVCVCAPQHRLMPCVCVYSLCGNVCVCARVSKSGCMCWVSQLCHSSISVKECPVPLMQSLIMVLTTWSLTLQCITLRDRTCTISTHSLTQCRTDREGEDEDRLLEVNTGAYFSPLLQNISLKNGSLYGFICSIKTSKCHCCMDTDMLCTIQ